MSRFLITFLWIYSLAYGIGISEAAEHPLAVSQAPNPAEQLKQCLAAKGNPVTVSYEDFAQGRPVRLLLHTLWHSSKKPSLDVPLTIFTTSTTGRLDQLKAQCRHWPGRLSAALYVPVKVPPAGIDQNTTVDPSAADMTPLNRTGAEVEALHREMESDAASCVLDVMLLYELITDDVMMEVLPINQLRNYAMLQARTDLVAMVDVDLLPSASLADYLRRQDNMQQVQQLCKNKTAVIIPAFSTAMQYKNEQKGHQLASDMSKVRSKARIRGDLMVEGLLYQFHGTYFREGHDCTNTNRWLSEYRFYSVRDCWHPKYEPWFIVDRRLNEPYDSLFRGFGWNKQSQVTHLYHQGFDFLVIPDGFLVHRQHGLSASRRRYNGGIKKAVTRFQERMMDKLQSRTYKPALDSGFMNCVQELSWWQGAPYTSLEAFSFAGGFAK